jgi:hypothetical protein
VKNSIFLFIFFIVQSINASFNVNVGNNIHLKGLILASNSNNLNLTTDTLTYENIYNKDKGSSYSAALEFNSSKKTKQK